VERPAECAQTAETDVEANVRYTSIRGTQEKHRTLNAPALEIAMRSLAERRAEGADEVRLGYLRNPREFRKRAIHGVPCAQHPAIALFYRPAHNITLYAVPRRYPHEFSGGQRELGMRNGMALLVVKVMGKFTAMGRKKTAGRDREVRRHPNKRH
jgi:hypothetical protein